MLICLSLFAVKLELGIIDFKRFGRRIDSAERIESNPVEFDMSDRLRDAGNKTRAYCSVV